MSNDTMTMKELAEAMRDIDFAMLTTRTDDGSLAVRPMSNNGEVAYDGDSYYFAWQDSRVVRDIAATPQVSLSFQGTKGLFGKPPLFIGVQGLAEVVTDKAAFIAHWSSGLDRWFEQGPDTPGLAMLAIRATRIHYWDGEREGELRP